jgi:hypothetical protein
MELDPNPASLAISAVVLLWPGVISETGDRKQLVFKVRGQEIGHMHGNAVAHFYFQPPLWQQLKREGRIEDHPVFPGRPGPAQRRIRSDEDLRDVVALLRLNYDALT